MFPETLQQPRTCRIINDERAAMRIVAVTEAACPCAGARPWEELRDGRSFTLFAGVSYAPLVDHNQGKALHR